MLLMERDAIREQTPIGLKVKEIMERGELVDDETMIAIVRDRLMRPDAKAGFLLDGFPRTVPQAQDPRSGDSGEGMHGSLRLVRKLPDGVATDQPDRPSGR